MEEQTQIVKEFSLPLFQSKGWMKLLGVVMIIYGVIIALSIVGILFAWLPIWLGVLLFKAATSAESAQMTGGKHHLMMSLEKLKMFFMINGIMMAIALAVGLISVLIAGGSIFSMMGNY